MNNLNEEYIPQAIHYEEANYLEYITKDVPSVCRLTDYPMIEFVYDMKTNIPIGWRIYNWSRIKKEN